MKKIALKTAAYLACFVIVALVIELLLWIWFGLVLAAAAAWLAYRAGRLIERLRAWNERRIDDRAAHMAAEDHHDRMDRSARRAAGCSHASWAGSRKACRPEGMRAWLRALACDWAII